MQEPPSPHSVQQHGNVRARHLEAMPSGRVHPATRFWQRGLLAAFKENRTEEPRGQDKQAGRSSTSGTKVSFNEHRRELRGLDKTRDTTTRTDNRTTNKQRHRQTDATDNSTDKTTNNKTTETKSYPHRNTHATKIGKSEKS